MLGSCHKCSAKMEGRVTDLGLNEEPAQPKTPPNQHVFNKREPRDQNRTEIYVPKPTYRSTDTLFCSKKKSNTPSSLKDLFQREPTKEGNRTLSCNYILLKPRNGFIEFYQNLLQFKLRYQRPFQGSTFSFSKKNISQLSLPTVQRKPNNLETQFII